MKYQPTPRDLFNPPPQAITYSNSREIRELFDVIDDMYLYGEKHSLFTRIINVLREHDEEIFKGIPS